MSVSLEQPMREAEIDLVELVNANETAIAQEVKTRTEQYTHLHQDIVDTNATVTELGNSLNTLNETVGKIGDRVTAMEFGTSNSVSISANSHTVVDITFESAKTEEPFVFPAIQSATAGVNLIATVQSVTNAQCSICVTNLGTTDVSDVTVDYLAISGR